MDSKVRLYHPQPQSFNILTHVVLMNREGLRTSYAARLESETRSDWAKLLVPKILAS